jgi:predicted DNA-binding transcriptional regulator AlpA
MQPLCHDYFVSKKIDPADVVGAHEIAERLNLSFPNVVHNWRSRHSDFPEPILVLKAGIFWDWNEIEEWIRKTNRMK